jgi:hypothetical protein
MTVSVGPTENNPTHIFSLSDGTTTLGLITCDRQGRKSIVDGWQQSPMPRTALKTASGAASYEDFELPFTSIIQDDYSGGMLAEDFEDDRTKYRDGRHCDTTRGDIICGPLPTEAADYGAEEIGSLEYTDSVYYPDADYFASSITMDQTITIKSIKVPIRGTHWRQVAIYSDSAGEPDTLLASGENRDYYSTDPEVYLDSTIELTDTTTYWVAIVYKSGLAGGGYVYAYMRPSTGKDVMYLRTGSWDTREEDYELAYTLVENITDVEDVKYFEYQRCLYALLNKAGNGAPDLYRNGYVGAGAANTAESAVGSYPAYFYTKTDQDLSGASLFGKTIVIWDGAGSEEEQPWRRIISNTTGGTNDEIRVDRPWKIAQDATTSWVVLGSDDWTAITGHGLTGKVYDIAVVKNYVLFTQGSGINMRRMRAYNNSGTWTLAYEADGTNKGNHLITHMGTDGKHYVWKSLIDSNQVAKAEAKAWGTAHSFGTAIVIGSDSSLITNMIIYGNPGIPYVLKEDSFGSIESDIYAEIPVGEMAAVRSSYNGNAVMHFGVYLYFNMGEMIERYYDQRLDDVGPNRFEGMPEPRNGIVRKLLPYPGRYYAALFTESNVPSILCNNGIGWNEVWRPTRVDDADSGATGDDDKFDYTVTDLAGSAGISDMIVQSISGNIIDKLWFNHGGKLMYIPISINPQNDSNYTYRDLSMFETAWIYGNLKDVQKYWHSIKMHSEGLASSGKLVKVEYKLDEDTSWTEAGIANTSPIEELELSDSYDVTGYRIKFRFTLHTGTSTSTPRIVAFVVKGVIRIDVKKGWSVRIISENERDLRGITDTQDNIMETLDAWANSDVTAVPLLLRHNIEYYDNKYVFIDPASLSFQQVELVTGRSGYRRQYKEIVQFTMYEV